MQVGNSNGLLHFIWESSENMGCDSRWCKFYSFKFMHKISISVEGKRSFFFFFFVTSFEGKKHIILKINVDTAYMWILKIPSRDSVAKKTLEIAEKRITILFYISSMWREGTFTNIYLRFNTFTSMTFSPFEW